MGRLQVNTGKGNQTINTNNVWDRIVALETNGVPKADMEDVKSQLAEKANQSDLNTTNANVSSNTSQLAEKLSLGQVAVTDIDKNKGKFDQTYMTDEFLQQIVGTAPINAVPAPDSVTLDKTTFYKRSTNLFNKNDVVANYFVRVSDGVLAAGTGFYASGFIKINPSINYTVKSMRHYAFYDSNKAYISGANGSITTQTVTSPANAQYMRFSWNTADVTLNAEQLNEGSTLLPYEEYKLIIPVIYQERQSIDTIDFKNNLSIYMTIGKNLIDKNKSTSGYFVNQANGTLAAGASYDASDYIEVVANTQYYISNTGNIRVAYYNSAKVFISGASFPTMPLTTPANTAYIRFSYDAGGSPQLELGSKATGYEPYGYKFAKELPAKKDLPLEIVLPVKLYALVGQELNIYFDNIMNDKDTRYDYDVTCTIGSQFDNYFRVVPTTAGSYSITIKAYQDNIERASVTSTIVVSATAVGNGVNKKLIVIGDSTTDSGTAVTKLNENFNSDVMDVTTIGTRGTAPNKHEGRSGWTARQYVTIAADQANPEMVNAFWNPSTSKFDFSYYMTNNGFSATDYVLINLGINDTFTYTDDASLNTRITETLSQFQEMINSIRTFSANIKIGVAVTVPPNYSQDSFARSYGNGQTRWRYKRNNFLWVKALINAYAGQEANNIYLIPINTNLDTKNNFPYDVPSPTVPINARNATQVKNFAANAGVHPDTSGYWQIADVYWYWLKSFEA